MRKTVKRRILMRDQRMFWPEWRRKVRRARKRAQRVVEVGRIALAWKIMPKEERLKHNQ